MNFWSRLRIFKIFLQLVRNPNRTDLIFKGVQIVSKDPNVEPVKVIERYVLSRPGFQQMFDQHYMPEQPTLEMLRDCPEGSFGRALYQHMSANGLDFTLFPRFDSDQPIQYLSSRIYQDHDLWHVLLGYGVEVEDELAIQAFGVAQLQSPIAVLLIAGGLLHLLGKNPRRAIEAFGKINDLYLLGRRTPFMLSVKIHDMFTKPLPEVRALCGLSV